jgi:hypothetical protein
LSVSTERIVAAIALAKYGVTHSSSLHFVQQYRQITYG